MTQYTVDIPESCLDDGITAAREAFNTDNPDTPIADNQGYVQFVMFRAAQSYATQYGTCATAQPVLEIDPLSQYRDVSSDADSEGVNTEAINDGNPA